MKLSYEKFSEKPTSTLNLKIKSIKSSTKLPNVENQIKIGNIYNSKLDENIFIEYENINLEKLTLERDKFRQELQKYKENRDEAKINYEFSLMKANQREKELRNKILLIRQKLNCKDFDILKSQINTISNQIVKNISDLDKEARVEIKNNKKDMNSRLSLKLLDAEHKHNYLLNYKYLDRQQKLNIWLNQINEMEKIKDDYYKIKNKSIAIEILNTDLKEKIQKKENENSILKAKITEFMKIMQRENGEDFEDLLAKNKKDKLNNFEKMKKIIDKRISLEDFNIKKEHKNLDLRNNINKNKLNNLLFKRDIKSKNILKNINLICEFSKSHENLKSLNLKSNQKLLKVKNDYIKEKVKFFIQEEKSQINPTSRRNSKNTQLATLKEELSLLENKSPNKENVENLLFDKSSGNASSQKISSNISKEIKFLGNNNEIDLGKLKIEFENRNTSSNVNSNNVLNNIKEKEIESNRDRNSNFYSEKNEISFFNLKNPKGKFNISNKYSIDGDFRENKKKDFVKNIENRIEIDKINILLEKTTEFLEEKFLVRENPRLASTMASFANILNNLKDKILNLKRTTQSFEITSKLIFEEVKEIAQSYKKQKIEKSLFEKHCFNKKDLVMDKVKESLTFKNDDTKKYMDAILTNEIILKEFENSTFKHIITKHNIFQKGNFD